MQPNKDSLSNTLKVATVLCLVCALVVSTAAVVLKPIQRKNAQLDRKKNILVVTGFTKDDIEEAGGGGKGIEALFAERFDVQIVDLRTGEQAAEQCKAAVEKERAVSDIYSEYDQLWASKTPPAKGLSVKLTKKEDPCGIKKREIYSQVFLLKNKAGEIERYVFPVRGNGLWSLMQGYLAVEPDFQTVAGLTFYQQAETPGLGGEVENPQWKKKWLDKQIYDGQGDVALKVIKGDQNQNPNGVDALSGATITSNGVTNMLEFWMGKDGFGPYIQRQKSGTLDRSNDQASTIGGNKGR
jgi:Na+-transporting NADH:ubiquinone oxidoreductase subunit C